MKSQLSATAASALGLFSTVVYAQVDTGSAAYQTGQNIGRIFGLVFLAVVVYKAIQWLRRK